MCKKCSEAVKQAIKNGVPEQVAIDWLWENTPFPIGDPTEKQYQELKKLSVPPPKGLDK